ncbi:NAD(+)/NADH kinase, partial [Acinetobacter baumannii]
TVHLYEPLAHRFSLPQHLLIKAVLFQTPEDLNKDIDCLISLGGDGTMLDTVTLVRDNNIPILGINFGRLGFLASISRDELGSAVDALVNHT